MVNSMTQYRKVFYKYILFSVFAAVLLFTAAAAYGADTQIRYSEQYQDLTLNWEPTRDIFINNATVFLGNVSGCILFGIPNFISIVQNGYLFGALWAVIAQEYNAAWAAAHFLPHAILEIPVILLAFSYGVLPWYVIREGQAGKRKDKRFWQLPLRYVGLSAVACMIVLLAAAAIESGISMRIK